MAKNGKPKPPAAAPRRAPWSTAELDRLIADATVDAYNESEQVTGLYTMIEDNLALPFVTVVLGAAASVEAVDITDDCRLVAVVKRGTARQRLPLEDLPLPDPPPAGAEWLAAYRRWRGAQ